MKTSSKILTFLEKSNLFPLLNCLNKIAFPFFLFLLMVNLLITIGCSGGGNDSSNSNTNPDPNYIIIDEPNFSNLPSDKKDEILDMFESSNPVVIKNPDEKSINDLLDYLNLDIPIVFSEPFEKIDYYGIDIDNNEYWEFISTITTDYIVKENHFYTTYNNEIAYTLTSYTAVVNDDDFISPGYNYHLSNWLNDNTTRKKNSIDMKDILRKSETVDKNYLEDTYKQYHSNIVRTDYKDIDEVSKYGVNEDNVIGRHSFTYHYLTIYQKDDNKVLDRFFLTQECMLSPKTSKDKDENPKYILDYIKEYYISMGKINEFFYTPQHSSYPIFIFTKLLPENKNEEKEISYQYSGLYGGTIYGEIGGSASPQEGLEINGKIGVSTQIQKAYASSAKYNVVGVKLENLSDAYTAKWKYTMDDSVIKNNEKLGEIVFPVDLSSSTFSPKHTLIFNIDSKTIAYKRSVNLPIYFHSKYKSANTIEHISADNDKKAYKVIVKKEKKYFHNMILTLRLTPIEKRSLLNFKIENIGNQKIKLFITKGLNHIKECSWSISHDNQLVRIKDDQCQGIEHELYEEGDYKINLTVIDSNDEKYNTEKIYYNYLPNIIVDTESIDFGSIPTFQENLKMLKIKNVSSKSLTLEFYKLYDEVLTEYNNKSDCPFHIHIFPPEKELIEPNKIVTALIKFSPKTSNGLGNVNASLIIKVKDSNLTEIKDQKTVKLSGVILQNNEKAFTNSFGMTFVRIPAGTFMMGSPNDEIGRYNGETLHQVTLTQDFYMQTTEVTQGQWKAVMGNNPSFHSSCGCDCPVEKVSWEDAKEFTEKLNQLENANKYRLPTEAQWEYAARAGSTTSLANGNLVEEHCGIDTNLNAMGWYCGNSGRKTHQVAQKQANAWGLYDMHGNVFEWCQDWYGSYPTNSVTDPGGASSGSGRVIRGGSWHNDAQYCRSANRYDLSPGGRNLSLGLRLMRTP